jgi:hypothetical protein
MVSQSGSPPIPMPVQVPPGHVMQQIVDENGTLRHVILSTQHQQLQGGVQHHIHGHYVSTRGSRPFGRARYGSDADYLDSKVNLHGCASLFNGFCEP